MAARKKLNSRPSILALILLGLIGLAGCGTTAPAPTTTSATNPTSAIEAVPPLATNTVGTTIRAVTTMSILADMVNNVGGDRVAAENIIPIGAGPEDYQSTPQDAQKIAGADILFYNGFGLEEWLDPLFESAGKPDMPRVAVATGLAGIDADDEFTQGNPHFWMSAANGVTYVANIRDALIKLDPAGEAVYTANAARYTEQLNALNTELKQQAATLPEADRRLVTNHDAFPYFAREYGFTIIGNLLANPEAQPSAGEIAQLVETIKRENVKAVFSESQFNPKLTQTLADEAGVSVVAGLYTDTLGEPGSAEATYIDMLRSNMTTIVDALSGEKK